MKDKGKVISTQGDLAQVEVDCFTEVCQKCSAHSLCIGQRQSKGILTVKNPLQASPGNDVEIDIPDKNYSKALIILFASLLLASLSGIGIGFFLSPFLPLSPSAASFACLLISLVITGLLLFRSFQKSDKFQFYPKIITILHKGENNG